MSQENVEVVKATVDAYNRRDLDAGEYVILPARICGHVAGSDADLAVDEVFVDKFRDGKIVEVREYRTREEALEAVGLSE